MGPKSSARQAGLSACADLPLALWGGGAKCDAGGRFFSVLLGSGFVSLGSQVAGFSVGVQGVLSRAQA